MPRVARILFTGVGLLLAVTCASFLAATPGHLRAADARQDWRPPPGWFDFDASRPIELDVRSPSVERQGHKTNLVAIGRVTFHLDRQGGLTATARAGVTCAEEVEYPVYAAVFDGQGRLLGAARTTCPVERLILRHVVQTARELTLDFGSSDQFSQARYAALTVGGRELRFPDPPQGK